MRIVEIGEGGEAEKGSCTIAAFRFVRILYQLNTKIHLNM